MIKENVASILSSLPQGILLVAASKTRTPDEVAQAIEAGISVLGYNYVQEAEQMHRVIGNAVRWHLIGHLQSNKAKRAVQLFDMIETIDSWKIAETVDRHCLEAGKIMPVLVEINSGKNPIKLVYCQKMSMILSEK